MTVTKKKWKFHSSIPSQMQVCFGSYIGQVWGFPGGSSGKESFCNAGDPVSIPGLGRSIGEGIGYPPQDSWTSLVVPLVKNPPAMWEKCFLVLHCSHSLLKDYNFYLRLTSSHLGNEKFSHFQTKTWNLSLEILVLILVVYYDFWVRSEYNAPYAKAVSMSRLLNVIRALYTLSSKRYTYLLFMVTFEKLSGKIFYFTDEKTDIKEVKVSS